MRWPVLFPSREQVAVLRLVRWLNQPDTPAAPSTRQISQALRLTPVETIIMLSKLSERGAVMQDGR